MESDVSTNEIVARARATLAAALHQRMRRQESDHVAVSMVQRGFEILETAKCVFRWSCAYAFFLEQESTELKLFERIQQSGEEAEQEFLGVISKQSGITLRQFEESIDRLNAKINVILELVSSTSEFWAALA
jgi:hypothetical protein